MVYTALSTAPDARKIERGESSQASNGVYEAIAVLAQRHSGNVASISFKNGSPLAAYVAGGENWAERGVLRAQLAHLSAMRLECGTRVPAITMTAR